MNYRQLGTLYKKEIMDVIRDKKTILTMVVLPIILYPLLFLAILMIMTMVTESQEQSTYYIAYDNVSEEHSKALNDWIAGEEDELEYVLEEVKSDNPEQDLKDETIDAYITVVETDSQISYEIHYLYAVTSSNTVATMLKEEIASYAKKFAEENVKAQGLDVAQVLYPVKSELKDHSSNESSLGSILGAIIPFLLITSILMGCTYPAIDATAGEKERGTMETLLTLPIGNMELIASKFLSVATLSIASVFMNVLSMGIVVMYLYTSMNSLSDGTEQIKLVSFIPAVLIAVVCVMTFALFLSALVMSVCAFAKSFKEANNYITPITLVVMLASYVGMIPTIELDTTTALIPVANIALLIKNLLIFKYDFTLILIVLLSNMIYAFAAVGFLGKVYNTESILFGEAFGSIKLFERRKNIKKGSMPTVQESLLIMIVALLLMVYVGGIVTMSNLRVGVLLQQAFIGLLPVMACLYIKGDVKKVFSIRLPKVKDFVGSLVLGIGAISLSLVVSSLLSIAFPSDSEGVNAQYMEILDGISFVPALLLIALTPAVCEELMYRGYMLTAFKEKMSLPKAFIIVSLLFAVSHMSLIKILPTGLIGMALAYVIHKSGSIVTSATIHFLNNGLAVFIMYYGSDIPALNDEQLGMPIMIGLFVTAVVMIPLGVLLLKSGKASDEENKNTM